MIWEILYCQKLRELLKVRKIWPAREECDYLPAGKLDTLGYISFIKGFANSMYEHPIACPVYYTWSGQFSSVI